MFLIRNIRGLATLDRTMGHGPTPTQPRPRACRQTNSRTGLCIATQGHVPVPQTSFVFWRNAVSSLPAMLAGWHNQSDSRGSMEAGAQRKPGLIRTSSTSQCGECLSFKHARFELKSRAWPAAPSPRSPGSELAAPQGGMSSLTRLYMALQSPALCPGGRRLRCCLHRLGSSGGPRALRLRNPCSELAARRGVVSSRTELCEALLGATQPPGP